VYFLTLITFGIYRLYWIVSTKEEIKFLSAEIPTAWLLILPIANLYFIYKYCKGFSTYVKRDNNTILWFILYVLAGIIMPVVQSELNKIAQ
jgi:hypothetical protein